MYQNILVPLDGSPTAGRGLHEAIELGRALGSRLRLLHIVNSAYWITPGAAPAGSEELFTQMRSSGESIVHEATVAARAAGVDVDSRLIEAPGQHAGEFIIDEARAWPAQLIVCGTHGRRGLRRLLMGSDAEYVLRHSEIPVLLVRSPLAEPK
jgi:nucleotide-binding universal stress UspA family protein